MTSGGQTMAWEYETKKWVGGESETGGRKPQVGNNAITVEAAAHLVKRGKPRAGQGDIVGELKGSKNSIQTYWSQFRT